MPALPDKSTKGASARRVLQYYLKLYKQRTGKPCAAALHSDFWVIFVPLLRNFMLQNNCSEALMLQACSNMVFQTAVIPPPSAIRKWALSLKASISG
jgi:hypothetical protein